MDLSLRTQSCKANAQYSHSFEQLARLLRKLKSQATGTSSSSLRSSPIKALTGRWISTCLDRRTRSNSSFVSLSIRASPVTFMTRCLSTSRHRSAWHTRPPALRWYLFQPNQVISKVSSRNPSFTNCFTRSATHWSCPMWGLLDIIDILMCLSSCRWRVGNITCRGPFPTIWCTSQMRTSKIMWVLGTYHSHSDIWRHCIRRVYHTPPRAIV